MKSFFSLEVDPLELVDDFCRSIVAIISIDGSAVGDDVSSVGGGDEDAANLKLPFLTKLNGLNLNGARDAFFVRLFIISASSSSSMGDSTKPGDKLVPVVELLLYIMFTYVSLCSTIGAADEEAADGLKFFDDDALRFSSTISN